MCSFVDISYGFCIIKLIQINLEGDNPCRISVREPGNRLSYYFRVVF